MSIVSLLEFLIPLVFSSIVIVVCFLLLADALLGGEDFVTSKKMIKKVGKIIEAYNCQNGLLYDLGSCRGAFSIGILGVLRDLRVVGIDNSYVRIWLSRMRSYFYSGSPAFVKADIFDTDVSKADLIFVYLPRALLPALETMLQRDLKSGALVITNRVNFPNWPPHQIFLSDSQDPKQEHLFVYRKT